MKKDKIDKVNKVESIAQSFSKSWSTEEVKELFVKPFNDLLMQAHQVLRDNFPLNEIQGSTLHNIKTGGCPENCGYCSQSAHYKTKLAKQPLDSIENVRNLAKEAKDNGASRFCMGAAWRSPRQPDLDKVKDMIKAVKELGLETCVTLGMINEDQARQLKSSGLDYYNHNIDTSENFYKNVVTTRTFQDRLTTLNNIDAAGINICCGLIIGMGETIDDRIEALVTLANLSNPPKSVPINMLVPVEGTPMARADKISMIDFIRVIAAARIIMPKSYVRLSAGRTVMSEEAHALCFFAGANSIFLGDRLLTTPNSALSRDEILLEKLGIKLDSHYQA